MRNGAAERKKSCIATFSVSKEEKSKPSGAERQKSFCTAPLIKKTKCKS